GGSEEERTAEVYAPELRGQSDATREEAEEMLPLADDVTVGGNEHDLMQVEPCRERGPLIDGDRVGLDRGVAGEFDVVSRAEVERAREFRRACRPLEASVSIAIWDRDVGDTIAVGVEREDACGQWLPRSPRREQEHHKKRRAS